MVFCVDVFVLSSFIQSFEIQLRTPTNQQLQFGWGEKLNGWSVANLDYINFISTKVVYATQIIKYRYTFYILKFNSKNGSASEWAKWNKDNVASEAGGSNKVFEPEWPNIKTSEYGKIYDGRNQNTWNKKNLTKTSPENCFVTILLPLMCNEWIFLFK